MKRPISEARLTFNGTWQHCSFISAAQDGDGNWLGAGDMDGRREANGIAGAAVFADSNFTPDLNIPEGPQAPGAERYCFIGQPHARVCTNVI